MGARARKIAVAAAGITAVAAAAAGPGSAAGRTPAGFATLKAGDTIAVQGAPLHCRATAAGIACWQTAGPATGSFGVLLGAPGGEARIRRVGAGGTWQDVAVRRPAGAGGAAAAARTVTLRVGQVARLRTPLLPHPLDCAVVKSAGLPTIYCSLDDSTGPVPGSYAVLLNARQAAIGRIGTDRGTVVTDLRAQPR